MNSEGLDTMENQDDDVPVYLGTNVLWSDEEQQEEPESEGDSDAPRTEARQQQQQQQRQQQQQIGEPGETHHAYYNEVGDTPAWIWPLGPYIYALPEVPPPSVKFQRLDRKEAWVTNDGPFPNVWLFSLRVMPAHDQGLGVWLVNPALRAGHWEGPEIPAFPAGTPVRVVGKAVARRIVRAFARDFGHDEGFGPGKPWGLKSDDVKLAAAVADYFRFDINGDRDVAAGVGLMNGEDTTIMNLVWDELVSDFDRATGTMTDKVKEKMGKRVKGPGYDIHKVSLGVAPVSNLGVPVPWILPDFVEDRDEQYRMGSVADANTLDERWE
ncbi:MAG: hypothetical protein Q9174_004330 [Haloplaca sp. 1 TL-2023]